MKYLPLILIIFISCSPRTESELPISIEGEWIPVFEDIGLIYDWSGLNFENDTVFEISDRWDVVIGPYFIFEDRIITDTFDGIAEFTILNHTKDSLTLEKNGMITHYYSRRLEYDNDLKFNSISISTYRCMDLCWEFDFMINIDGFAVFNGKYNTQTTGIKEGRLNDRLLKEIDSMFKWSNIKQLDPERVAIPAMDGWLINFDINYNDNQSVTFSTTDWELPYRIKPIFYLIDKHLKEEGLK